MPAAEDIGGRDVFYATKPQFNIISAIIIIRVLSTKLDFQQWQLSLKLRNNGCHHRNINSSSIKKQN